ncbi:MAG: alcohol dehydrogenase [Alphaproteobacteria bacterium]|nr:alcohol dehydrogenase [Alphaproteobacteria bacterium]|tara:strand:- start:775 stop:1794 length:1020 start_codon:yes stop_codon:yes gene_type:complete
MKAIRLHVTGGPEVLQLDEIDTPVAGPGQVLVKAHSIGIGLADQLVRDGRYPWMPELPTIPGIEMSGTVAALGEGVTKFREGDPVIVSAVPERSCYAEYLAANANWVFPCSHGVDLAVAGCLMNYRVAHRILQSGARVRAGETIAIVGAGGGLGSAILDLANAAELETIALARSAEKAAFATARDASHVIDTGSNDLTDSIMDITGGRGVDHFIDPVGGAGFVGHLDQLAIHGTLVLYGMIEGLPQDDVFAAQTQRWARCPAVRVFSIHSFDHAPEMTGADLDLLMRMAADGSIDPAIYAEMPLDEAMEAHRHLDDGRIMGKLLLQPHRSEAHFTNGNG